MVVISRIDLYDDHKHVASANASATEKDGVVDGVVSVVPPPATAKTTNNTEDVVEEVIPPVVVSNVTESTIAEAAPTSFKVHLNLDKAFIEFRRAPSAKLPVAKFPHQNFCPLPNGDCGDGIVNPHDCELNKYWAQRKRLFSRFDEGIQMDKEGWYSVTPESIANHLASRVVHMHKDSKDGLVVLDAFAGCGGNVIAFALRPEVSLVVCADTDISKLRIVSNNARVYGIHKKKILLLHCDACTVLEAYKDGIRVQPDASSTESKTSGPSDYEGYKVGGLESLPDRIDTIFLSPPWGGMDYEQSGKQHFDIATSIKVRRSNGSTCDGEELLQLSVKAQRCVLYFLPRNVNGVRLSRIALKAGYRDAIEIEQNNLNDKLKTVTAYFGFNSSKLLL
jgi:trimethylguanosine synthase